MTEKWRREIEQGSNPAEPITARVLDTGAKPAVDVLAKIRRVDGRVLNAMRTANRCEMVIESTAAGQRSILADASCRYRARSAHADGSRVSCPAAREGGCRSERGSSAHAGLRSLCPLAVDAITSRTQLRIGAVFGRTG